MREQFAQNFGVWREADAGRNVVFDVMFPRGSKLPAKGQEPLRIVRTYRPVHNVGHFRYLECSHLDDHSQPQGEISNWDEIRVPFDPRCADWKLCPAARTAFCARGRPAGGGRVHLR